MHRKYFSIVLTILFTGCSSIAMNRTVNSVDKRYLEEKLGSYTIIAIPLSRSYINYLKAVDRQSQISDDKTLSDKLQSMRYRENQFFLFEIRHLKVLNIKKGDFMFSLCDAKGRNRIDEIFHFEKMFSDTVLGNAWIIKTREPITSENFSADELPVTLNIKFLNQEMQYEISPR